MKKLKLSRYYTMNNWNNSTAPAFNLKVYNVIPPKYQQKVYEMMNTDDYYEYINALIVQFNHVHNYEYQAGFNGRSNGYLVLYKGGVGSDGRIFVKPGINIADGDVPKDVLTHFIKLANDIVKTTINLAKNSIVKEITINEPKKIKILERKNTNKKTL